MSGAKLERNNSLNQTDIAKLVAELKDVDCTEHWLRKMKTMFNIYNPSGSGVITKDSMTGYKVDKTIKVTKPSSEEEAKYKELITNWVNDVFQNQDTMTFTQFYKTHYVTMTNPEMREMNEILATKSSELKFKMIDTNHNGTISLKEWRTFYATLRDTTQEEADEAFKAIDLNQDGVMSLEEYKAARWDYVTNQKHSKYDSFLGPLAEL